MDLRDYLAAHAIFAAYRIVDDNLSMISADDEFDRLWKEGDEDLIAANAYDIADAMLRLREKKNG